MRIGARIDRGICLYRQDDGNFSSAIPNASPISDLVFGNDPKLPSSRCHIFGYSTYGTLLTWSEEHDDVRVSLIDITAAFLRSTQKGASLAPDAAISLSLFQLDTDVWDALDRDGKLLFAWARKALGTLTLGQVYGFVPMLALGGSCWLKTSRWLVRWSISRCWHRRARSS